MAKIVEKAYNSGESFCNAAMQVRIAWLHTIKGLNEVTDLVNCLRNN